MTPPRLTSQILTPITRHSRPVPYSGTASVRKKKCTNDGGWDIGVISRFVHNPNDANVPPDQRTAHLD